MVISRHVASPTFPVFFKASGTATLPESADIRGFSHFLHLVPGLLPWPPSATCLGAFEKFGRAAPRGSVSCVSYVRLQTTGIARHAHSAVQQHDLGPMRAASKAPMNHVSATNQSDEEREPPPEATVNPDNIGIDLDVSSSELLSPESRSSTSPALVPRSPRLRSSRGESMERRPVPLSKPAPAH